jgi:hypothetical protein
VIPYIWNSKIVTFDTRDITGKAINKYIACPADREEIPRKSILYGIPEKWGKTGICVEGCTDVWRMGQYSFSTSGIKYTPQQVRIIAKSFKRVAVCFDPEPQAIVQANKLIAELKFRKIDAFRVDLLSKDPGDLSDSEAQYIVQQII